MNVRHLVMVAAIAISTLPVGVGPVNAARLDPLPPSPISEPDPGGPTPGIPAEKCWRYGRVGPGGPRGGGGQPMYPQQCPSPAPPPG